MATPITIGAAGGEYMEAVVILEWMAKPGEAVKKDDVIVVVETAKASSEILAPCDGFLSAVFFNEGDEAPVSEVLGLIGVTSEDTVVGGAPVTEGVHEQIAENPTTTALATNAVLRREGRVVASPIARIEAVRLGIDLAVVPSISATGRVKLRDVLAVKENGGIGCTENIHLGLSKTGNGDSKILLLHGFGADAMSWYPLTRSLSQSHQVIALDLPNHGRSPQEPTESLQALVDHVVRAVDALQIDSFHLVGHSLGAAVAAVLASIRPQKVLSITLLAPAGCGAGVNSEFVHGLSNATSIDALRISLELMVADKQLITNEFLGAVMASRATPGLIEAQRKMATDLFPVDKTTSIDVSEELKQLTCPIQFVWGMADNVIPLAQARDLPANAKVTVLPGIGHVPQLEAPNEVLEIIRALTGMR